MTKKNIEISLLNDTDIDEVNNFHNFIYKDNRTKEDFLWEFYNAPAGKAIYVIAKDTELQKIVGTQCAIPIILSTKNGIDILTAKSEDTLVNPEYRGLSIFENMYQLLFDECKKNGIKYIWGFTTAKKPFIKLGFDIPYDHSQSLMSIDVNASYKYLSKLNIKNNTTSLFKIFALSTLSKIRSIKRCFISEKSISKEFSCSVYDYKVVKDNSKIIKPDSQRFFYIKQDVPYLTWRIVNNPNHEKIFNVYFSFNDEIVSNIIFNHHKNGVWYLINDLYADNLTEKQKIAILNKSVRLLLSDKENNVRLIRTWDFSHNDYGLEEIKLRKKVGFTHIDRGISFVWKSLDEKNILNVNDFILSRIASQGVI